MTCIRCQHHTCKRFGYFGKRRIQRWRCNSCKATFCEPHTRLTRETLLSRPDVAARAIQCLVEGCSIRSTERLTGLNRNTIMRLLILVGARCSRLMDTRMRNLRPKYLQLDEIWPYVGKKARPNAFSKKLGHLKAAIALHFAYYNLCRIHSSLRVTPAMEAGITDHAWNIQELISGV